MSTTFTTRVLTTMIAASLVAVAPAGCRMVVAMHFVPLRDGWYVHACVEPKK